MPSPQAIRIISSKRYSITVFENHFFALQALQLTVLQFLKTIFLRYKRYSITVFENHFFALQALQLTVLQFLKTIFLRYKRYRLQYYSF